MENEIILYGTSISAKITALALAKQNFSVSLIPDNDLKIKKKLQSNLVTFLSNGSINYLSSIIKDFSIFNHSEPISQIECTMERATRRKEHSVNFRDRNKLLGKIIKNSLLDKCLTSEIKQLENIKILDSSMIVQIDNKGDGIKLIFDNEQNIDSKLLIITSSNYKRLLKNLGINFIYHDFQQEALSIIVKGKIENINCAHQQFTSDGPLAFLPYLKNEASLIWSLKKNSKFLSLNNSDLKLQLEEKLKKIVEIEEIISIEKFKLNMTYAKKLFDKNAVVMGNVAHNIHPIAGQGLNLSIKDTAQFTKLLCKYRAIGYEINDYQILKNFDLSRKIDNTAYSFGTLALDSILSSRNKILNYLTDKGFKIVESNKYLKRKLIQNATGSEFFKSY